jgi:hypothetical protein
MNEPEPGGLVPGAAHVEVRFDDGWAAEIDRCDRPWAHV